MAAVPREALTIERDMLRALAADAPRGRPEILRRLRIITAELLRLELKAPLPAVPEHPETDGHELRYFQK